MKTFTEKVFRQKVQEGQLDPQTDFFGTGFSAKMVEVIWTRSGKRETVRVRLDITPEDPFEGLTGW